MRRSGAGDNSPIAGMLVDIGELSPVLKPAEVGGPRRAQQEHVARQGVQSGPVLAACSLSLVGASSQATSSHICVETLQPRRRDRQRAA